MKQLLSLCACVPAITLLTACGGGEVVVLAQIEQEASVAEDSGPLALGNLPVFFLPYDRDAIFDSLEAAMPEPEPAIPDTLFVLQSLIPTAREEVQEHEAVLSAYRDSLQAINAQMGELDRASAEYSERFREFQAVEERYQAAQQVAEEANQRLTAIQDELTTVSREIRLARDEWANQAFADVDRIVGVKLMSLKLEPVSGTTGTDGVVVVEVPPGQWWVFARYQMPFSEMYWNIPVEVARGERVEIRLSEDNAVVRPIL